MIEEEIVEIESPNYGRRTEPIDCIVIHDSGGYTAKATLDWFSSPLSKVSAHYVVGKDGTVYRCVQDEDKAWHCGPSTLFGRENVNNFSLGIELINDDKHEKYTDEQLDALFQLVGFLCSEYQIPLNRIVGHCHVAPGRRTDPGDDFPWFEFLNSLGGVVLAGGES